MRRHDDVIRKGKTNKKPLKGEKNKPGGQQQSIAFDLIFFF